MEITNMWEHVKLPRTQNDGQGDFISRATAKDCSTPVIVRPEFGPESEVRNILRKYGAVPMTARQPNYTTTDFDTDLTTAITKIKRANDAFDALPQKHRDKFQTPASLWQHYVQGQLFDDREPDEKTILDKATATGDNTDTSNKDA